ncbi:enhancer of mRNA-decapping protein 3-like [Nilaparvata lugens]|uniref:enhancer of mRNA-decapping protein 3-like n=1 Tax=Nilaparvata lugens TaxID=108931 RepID=UPI00193D2410|nr:enhancer of mRNA-decapping protein 3-like [Nilaparvata lugens]
MEQQWIGCTVSVDCGPLHGTYQGEVNKINKEQQILILKKAFLNGAPHPDGNVTIMWEMIKNLSILKTAEENKETKPATSRVQVRKPVAKRMDRSVSENIVASRSMPKNCVMNRMTMPQSSSSHNLGELATKATVPTDFSASQNSYQAGTTPNKKDRPRQNSRWVDKNEACFGEPVDNIMHKEFDFEKNLALFNKKAVYDEINAQKPDLVSKLTSQ